MREWIETASICLILAVTCICTCAVLFSQGSWRASSESIHTQDWTKMWVRDADDLLWHFCKSVTHFFSGIAKTIGKSAQWEASLFLASSPRFSGTRHFCTGYDYTVCSVNLILGWAVFGILLFLGWKCCEFWILPKMLMIRIHRKFGVGMLCVSWLSLVTTHFPALYVLK